MGRYYKTKHYYIKDFAILQGLFSEFNDTQKALDFSSALFMLIFYVF